MPSLDKGYLLIKNYHQNDLKGRYVCHCLRASSAVEMRNRAYTQCGTYEHCSVGILEHRTQVSRKL